MWTTWYCCIALLLLFSRIKDGFIWLSLFFPSISVRFYHRLNFIGPKIRNSHLVFFIFMYCTCVRFNFYLFFANQRQHLCFVPISETGGYVLVVMTRGAMDTYCFLFFSLHYFIPLQWIWLMIMVVVVVVFECKKKRISIEWFKRRCEFLKSGHLFCLTCLRKIWWFAYFPFMAHPEYPYDLRLINKFNNFPFFSGFKYFTK